jgi:Tol biopolymer transport system component
LAWSRDSRSIAFSTTRELYVVPRDDGPGDLVCTCGAFGLAFLPDGRLTYVDHGAIEAVDLSSGNASTLARYTGATDAAWSPDGRYAVVTTDDTFFSVVDFSMSPPAQVQPRHVAGLFVRWSPSGDRFVYVASIGHTYRTVRSELWVAAPGQRPRMLHRFPHVAGGLAPPVWSPDGSTLELYQGNGNGADGTISLVDATTGDVVGTVSGAEGGAAWQRAPGSTE